MTAFEQDYGRTGPLVDEAPEEERPTFVVATYGHGFEVQGPDGKGRTIQWAHIKRHPNATEAETRARAELVAAALNFTFPLQGVGR